jgi:hypothetical protein
VGFFPFRACSTSVQDPVSRSSTRSRARPCTTCVSEKSAVSPRYCETRPPTPRLHEPGIRRRAMVYRTPHATVRQQPCSTGVSRTPVTPVASPPCMLPRTRGDLPVPPLGGTPRLPHPSHRPYPRRGPWRWVSKTLLFEPSTRFRPSRDGRVSHPSRGEPDPPLPSGSRSPYVTWTAWDPGSREPGSGGGPHCCQLGQLS